MRAERKKEIKKKRVWGRIVAKKKRKNAIVKSISAKEWVCVACLLHERVRPVEHLGIRMYAFVRE